MISFGGSKMVQITKDTVIGDILDIAPETAPVFFSIGMHCLGCPSSRGETVEEACMVHGIEVDALLQKLNETIAAEKAKKL
jgi:hybrid cluster-associated redox disulfide protein